MSKKATPAPEKRSAAVNTALVKSDVKAADDLALATAQLESNVRAVAATIGYQLPSEFTDPDLIQRDIASNMRRSVEACLEVGKGLTVLKVASGHGNFIARLEVLGIEPRVAQRFMQSATKFATLKTSATLKAIGNQTKLFEMLVLDDEQIAELELTGQTGELSLDDVATMSVKELRKAVREGRAEAKATEKLLASKDAKLNKLKNQIAKATPDEKLADLQKEAAEHMNTLLAGVRGELRQSLIALQNQAGDLDLTVFMSGLVGQLQVDLTALREEFELPDISDAAELERAQEVGQWMGDTKKKAK